MTLVETTGATLVYEFQPTTPHGTSSSAPYVEALTLPSYKVEKINFVVPPGPQGNLGWALTYSGEVMFPTNGGWIITDNEKNEWVVEGQPINGTWGFRGYNSGTYDHTVYLRFVLEPGSKPTVEVPTVAAQLIVPTWPTPDVL